MVTPRVCNTTVSACWAASSSQTQQRGGLRICSRCSQEHWCCWRGSQSTWTGTWVHDAGRLITLPRGWEVCGPWPADLPPPPACSSLAENLNGSGEMGLHLHQREPQSQARVFFFSVSSSGWKPPRHSPGTHSWCEAAAEGCSVYICSEFIGSDMASGGGEQWVQPLSHSQVIKYRPCSVMLLGISYRWAKHPLVSVWDCRKVVKSSQFGHFEAPEQHHLVLKKMV